MQADPEEQLSQPETSRSRAGTPVVIAGIVVVAIVAAWFFMSGDEPAAPPPPPVAVEVHKPEPPPAPDIPVQEPAPAAPVEPEVVLTPQQQTEMLRESINAASGSPLFAPLLASEKLVSDSAAVIDGLSNGAVLRKFLPLAPPAGRFPVSAQGEQLVLDTAGYSRYDAYAQAIADLDTELLVQSFHSFRSLYEATYRELGMAGEEFDNDLIRALDRVLATPELEEVIYLEQKSVMYTYADPRLESLDALQKQLLRMGPDNVRKIKAKAREIRTALLQ